MKRPDEETMTKTTEKTKTQLADAIATPDGKRRYVRTLFSTIADRYDLITVLLSYGQDQRWKRRLVDLVPARGAVPADVRWIWRPGPVTSRSAWRPPDGT